MLLGQRSRVLTPCSSASMCAVAHQGESGVSCMGTDPLGLGKSRGDRRKPVGSGGET